MVLPAFTTHNAFRVFSDLVQWLVTTGGHIGATRVDRPVEIVAARPRLHRGPDT